MVKCIPLAHYAAWSLYSIRQHCGCFCAKILYVQPMVERGRVTNQLESVSFKLHLTLSFTYLHFLEWVIVLHE